jgi:hypothetical protein
MTGRNIGKVRTRKGRRMTSEQIIKLTHSCEIVRGGAWRTPGRRGNSAILPLFANTARTRHFTIIREERDDGLDSNQPKRRPSPPERELRRGRFMNFQVLRWGIFSLS